MPSNIKISQKKPVVFLFGPTASGKTDFVIDLAKKFPIEIISVDSVMVYTDCDIGSAKPSKDILSKYPHHMVDIISPKEIFTVAEFCKLSEKIIKNSHDKKRLPVFVGGSMMYFKSLLVGIHDLPEKHKDYRDELDKLKNSNEKNFLYNYLKTIDPVYAKEVNENDEVRIIRALEVFKITGKPISKIIKLNSKKSLNDEYDVFQFGITNERDILHQRIKTRLNEIIDRGLIEEAENLLKKYDIDSEHPIKRAVNYKQVFSYLKNEYDKDIFYEKALYATRQLAKRQITWLRSWDKFMQIKPNQSNDIDNAFKKILSTL